MKFELMVITELHSVSPSLGIWSPVICIESDPIDSVSEIGIPKLLL
jgi:hypothetical protein